MNQSESLPWTDVYSAVLDDASRFRHLSDGLDGESSVSTFSEGHLIVWDLSGYTRVVGDLDAPGQKKLSESIFYNALNFGKKVNAVLIQPPAGDQGIYYAKEDPGELPISDLVAQIQEDACIPKDSLSAKTVVVPHDKNALFLGTFLSPKRKGSQVGYTAVMGSAYTRALSRLSKIPKSAIIRTEKPRPFTTSSFREINLSKPRTSKKYVEDAVKVLSTPQVPEGPYVHAVLRAWDASGRANLVDPCVSSSLASSFFEHRNAWQAVKQDEGQLHIVSKENSDEARMSLRALLDSIERDMGLPGTKIQFASTSVRNAVRLQVRDHVDFAGMHVIDLVHKLKGKNVDI